MSVFFFRKIFLGITSERIRSMDEFRGQLTRRIDSAERVEFWHVASNAVQPQKFNVHKYHAVLQMLKDAIKKAPLMDAEAILINLDSSYYRVDFMSGADILTLEVRRSYLWVDGKWFDLLYNGRIWNTLDIIALLNRGGGDA